MVSTLRLYNVYKEFSEIVSTQLCNNTVISIVLVINHDYTTIRKILSLDISRCAHDFS